MEKTSLRGPNMLNTIVIISEPTLRLSIFASYNLKNICKYPDTPNDVKKIQEQIWLSKPIEERLRLSIQMIDDARDLQIHGIKMRHPDWTDDQIRIYRLRRMMSTDPTLAWLEKVIGK